MSKDSIYEEVLRRFDWGAPNFNYALFMTKYSRWIHSFHCQLAAYSIIGITIIILWMIWAT